MLTLPNLQEAQCCYKRHVTRFSQGDGSDHAFLAADGSWTCLVRVGSRGLHQHYDSLILSNVCIIEL